MFKELGSQKFSEKETAAIESLKKLGVEENKIRAFIGFVRYAGELHSSGKVAVDPWASWLKARDDEHRKMIAEEWARQAGKLAAAVGQDAYIAVTGLSEKKFALVAVIANPSTYEVESGAAAARGTPSLAAVSPTNEKIRKYGRIAADVGMGVVWFSPISVYDGAKMAHESARKRDVIGIVVGLGIGGLEFVPGPNPASLMKTLRMFAKNLHWKKLAQSVTSEEISAARKAAKEIGVDNETFLKNLSVWMDRMGIKVGRRSWMKRKVLTKEHFAKNVKIPERIEKDTMEAIRKYGVDLSNPDEYHLAKHVLDKKREKEWLFWEHRFKESGVLPKDASILDFAATPENRKKLIEAYKDEVMRVVNDKTLTEYATGKASGFVVYARQLGDTGARMQVCIVRTEEIAGKAWELEVHAAQSGDNWVVNTSFANPSRPGRSRLKEAKDETEEFINKLRERTNAGD